MTYNPQSRQHLLGVAAKELGNTEFPARTNKQKYGEWYGMNGVAWCAIFVSWCYHHAGFPLPKIEKGSYPGYHYVPSLVSYAKKNKLVTILPAPGDIVCFDWDGDKKADHTGIFKRWANDDKTQFECIEGNTSPTNQSNGGAVMLRTRNISQVSIFVNLGVL